MDWCTGLVYDGLHGATDILSLQKLFLLYEAFFSLLGSHLDIPERILMTIPYGFIPSLVATNKKTFS